MLSLLRVRSFDRGGGDKGRLKREGKEPSVKDKLIIDVIGVIRMSLHYSSMSDKLRNLHHLLPSIKTRERFHLSHPRNSDTGIMT